MPLSVTEAQGRKVLALTDFAQASCLALAAAIFEDPTNLDQHHCTIRLVLGDLERWANETNPF